MFSYVYLLITLLAYHFIHTLRMQLKSRDSHHSWSTIRQLVRNRQRLTFSADCENGRSLHLRKTTRMEPHQSPIYAALNCSVKLKTLKMLI